VVVAPDPETALVVMTTSVFAFPGESQADTWLKSQRDSLIVADTTPAGTFTEVPQGPSPGDAAATFSTRRTVGEGEQSVGGFRMYSRVGAIVAVLEIESSADVPLDGAARLMRFQVECIERQGCSGLASVPQNLFGNEDDPVAQRLPRPRTEEPASPPTARPALGPVQELTPGPIEEPAPVAIGEPTLVPIEEPAPDVIEEPPVVEDDGAPPEAGSDRDSRERRGPRERAKDRRDRRRN